MVFHFRSIPRQMKHGDAQTTETLYKYRKMV